MKPIRPSSKLFSKAPSVSRTYHHTPSSPLAFFDSPPPPSSSRSRISLEGPNSPRSTGEGHSSSSSNSHSGTSNGSGGQQTGHHPPYSLALPNGNGAFKGSANNFPGSAGGPGQYYTNSRGMSSPYYGHPSSQSAEQAAEADFADEGSHRARKRARMDPVYVLDVGAYGIPKRRGHHHHHRPVTPQRGLHTYSAERDNMPYLSVQVGEDSYFVSPTGDALGVADGVGGWARQLTPEISRQVAMLPPSSTPSSIFSGRFMHFCAEESRDAFSRLASPPPPPVPSTALPPSPIPTPLRDITQAWRSPNPYFNSPPIRSLKHPIPILSAAEANDSQWLWDGNAASPIYPPSHPQEPTPADEEYVAQLQEELEDELEELSEGIDVLNIMEKAFEKTVRAHVVPRPPSPLFSSSAPLDPSPIPAQETKPAPSLQKTESGRTVPLLAGSTTALIAVLDHVSVADVSSSSSLESESRLSLDIQQQSEDNSPSSTTRIDAATRTSQPVLRVAHVGDCMGMLIRPDAENEGEYQIVWRSNEMWVGFNTPVQLSALPSSPVPQQAAEVIELNVKSGDMLVIASDGLSDNLWDEDILDEVKRVKASVSSSSSSSASCSVASSPPTSDEVNGKDDGKSELLSLLRRHQSHPTLATVLSEALCSRARRVSEGCWVDKREITEDGEKDTPFARRAKESGRKFRGGKADDISVVVAVISPAKEQQDSAMS